MSPHRPRGANDPEVDNPEAEALRKSGPTIEGRSHQGDGGTEPACGGPARPSRRPGPAEGRSGEQRKGCEGDIAHRREDVVGSVGPPQGRSPHAEGGHAGDGGGEPGGAGHSYPERSCVDRHTDTEGGEPCRHPFSPRGANLGQPADGIVDRRVALASPATYGPGDNEATRPQDPARGEPTLAGGQLGRRHPATTRAAERLIVLGEAVGA